jgi:hypothetical protein
VPEPLKPVGLDYEIFVGERKTTIRKEAADGNASSMRLYEKTAQGQEKSLEYFAVVYRQHNDSTSYSISEADFRYLRGQGILLEFAQP